VDYGCGSGILGLAALRLGAAYVVAVDHDPQALWASRRNATANQLDAYMSVCAPGELAESGTAPSADLLLANILLEPLLALAGRFAAMVRPGGQVVLSGILTSQYEGLLQGFLPWFKEREALFQEGWACLVMQRRPGV
jgi:ribosomal protein L11 methyltransferase